MTRLTRRNLLGVSAICLGPFAFMNAQARATPVATPVASKNSAPVSMLIQNSGSTQDRLVGATTPVAESVVLHATQLENGQRVMHPVDAIVVPAGATIGLEPGAMHLMLSGLEQDLVQGQSFPLTLHFAEAGEVAIEVRVRRKQDAAGVPATSRVVAGSLTILHASAPPAPASDD
jgi:copper(I)-binding protein